MINPQNYRDSLAHIRNSVSIIGYYEEALYFGCTISSLTSVAINDSEKPVLLVVLKNESVFAKKLAENKDAVIISVLSSDQANLATMYSERRFNDNIGFEIHQEIEVLMTFNVRIRENLIVQDSLVYFFEVYDFTKNLRKINPLTYWDRKFD